MEEEQLNRIPLRVLHTSFASKEEVYLRRFSALPENLRELLTSPRTGAFLFGLMREKNVPISRFDRVMLSVIKVVFGDVGFSDLPFDLEKAGITKDIGSNMSLEIEKDLFAPVVMELGKVQKQAERPAGKSENTTSPSPSLSRRGDQRPEHSGMSNVLDLKEKKYPPAPPPIR